MKLAKPKSKKGKIIAAVIALVVLAGLGYVWFHATQSNRSAVEPGKNTEVREVNDVDYSPPTTEDQKQQDQQKEEIIQNAGEQPNPTTMSVVISRASQSDVGEPLYVRTIVTGAATGTCDITFTKDGQTAVTKTVSIATEATYNTCADAAFTASDFAEGGDWKLQVIAKNGSTASQPATVTVTIRK